jgi:general secretion pathway protein G
LKKSYKEGFTLFEVLIVLAVIAVIASISIPAVGNILKKADATKVVTEMNNTKTALMNFIVMNRSEAKESLEISKLYDEGYLENIPSGISIEVDPPNAYILYDMTNHSLGELQKIDSNIKEKDGKPSVSFRF